METNVLIIAQMFFDNQPSDIILISDSIESAFEKCSYFLTTQCNAKVVVEKDAAIESFKLLSIAEIFDKNRDFCFKLSPYFFTKSNK